MLYQQIAKPYELSLKYKSIFTMIAMKFSSFISLFLLVKICLGRESKGNLERGKPQNIQNRDGKCTYTPVLLK